MASLSITTKYRRPIPEAPEQVTYEMCNFIPQGVTLANVGSCSFGSLFMLSHLLPME